MTATFSHIVLNVSQLEAATKFYLDALEPLGFSVADGVPDEYVRITNGTNLVIVLNQVTEPSQLNT